MSNSTREEIISGIWSIVWTQLYQIGAPWWLLAILGIHIVLGLIASIVFALREAKR
jgi:hypothetical protein